METDKQIQLDATRLYGFRIAAQPIDAGQQRALLGAKIGTAKKTDSRLGSKIGTAKRY